jgi:hypothetical protein
MVRIHLGSPMKSEAYIDSLDPLLPSLRNWEAHGKHHNAPLQRRRKLSVHISRPNNQFRKRAWSRTVFAGIERAGGIKLYAYGRQRLRWETKQYVEGYSRWKDEHSKAPKRLDLLIATLGETIRALEESGNVGVWAFSDAGLSEGGETLKDEIARLQSLRQTCVDMREGLKAPGRKFNFYRNEFIGRLAIVFIELGGTWTTVRRVEDPSKISPFLKFAWAVLQQVPSSMRPPTVDALAMAWKRRGLEPTFMLPRPPAPSLSQI